MSQLPPPPPGADDAIPPPPGSESFPEPPVPEPEAAPVVHEAPPPAPSSEQYESDLLKRRKRFSWRNFGGDGFLISVAFHVLLVILGLFWVISQYVEAPSKQDPDVFATGAGGGNNGDKPKAYETKMKSRQTMVKSPSRIVSKSATASVTLPSTPSTNTASFASGLSAGGMSKGSGGGSGGGEGTGIGVGRGGGKNFVSLFGARGLGETGLKGTFYDCKQLPDGRPSPYAEDKENNAFVDRVLRTFVRNWNVSTLERFFKAPEQLTARQIFIPMMSADAAPKAYQVEDKCKGRRWVAHYKGSVIAPKTGRFRFICFGDDVMAVRFDQRMVGDGGFTVLGFAGHLGNFGGKPDPKRGRPPGITDDTYKGAQSPPFRCGPWFDVARGREYPLEIILSEVPGGLFSGYLLMEEAGPDGKTDGNIFLFRMSDEDLPEGTKQDTGLKVDMTGKGLIWRSKAAKATPVR